MSGDSPLFRAFRRALLAIIAAPLLLVAVVAGFSVWQVHGLLRSMALVDETDEVIAQSRRVSKLALDMETGLRGYLLTRDPSYLEPYRSAEPRLEPELRRLASMVRDTPEQEQQLGRVQAALDGWLGHATRAITLPDGGPNLGLETGAEGKQRMDAFRAEMAAFQQNEERLRNERVTAAEQRVRRNLVAMVLAMLFAGVISTAISRREFVRLSVRYRRALDQQEHALAALRRTEAGLRALLDALPTGVLVHRQGEITFSNPALRSMLGYAQEQLENLRALDLVAEADRERAAARIAATPTAEPTPTIELRMRRADAGTVVVEANSTRIPFQGETATVAYFQDVTQRRAMTARMMEMDRMVAVGTVAAGVGHEINNPLAYVSSNLEFVRSELQRVHDGEPLRPEVLDDLLSSLADGQEGVSRIRQIVKDLRGFARVDDRPGDKANLNEVVASALNIARGQLRSRAEVLTELAENLPPVAANEGRLGQVFLNLMVNAAHAIPEGAPAQHRVTVRTFGRDGAAVAEVADTGSGISPEVLGRIFDPFFTTKPVGQGTGLGLAICRSIVGEAGGRIEVESEVGRGSIFRVVLPALLG